LKSEKYPEFILTKPLIFLMAVVCGVTVANLYYIQPLEAQIASAFHVSQNAAGAAAMLTQIGYALGLLLFVPLGDMAERRSVILRMLLLVTASLLLAGLAPTYAVLLIAMFIIGMTTIVPQLIVPYAAQLMKFINDSCLLTYDVRTVRINDYLISLYRIARLLSQSGLYAKASKDVVDDVVQMVHVHTEALKANEKYQEYADQVRQFKLSTQIFDVFGETVDNYSVHDLFTTTDTDIDRQFRLAETKLGNEGVGNEYGRQYFDVNDPNAFKIDVIIFASDSECIGNLKTYAEAKFHALNDEYRRYIATIDSERIRRQYDSIVSDGDIVSKHNFRLPETIQVPHENGGKEYRDHLFVDGNSGMVTLNLNNWEEGVIAEEEQRLDFVCWLRNPPRKTWSLCIPYEIDGETKPTYPDFIVVRRDSRLGYVIDILEPHNPAFTDNLGKAKGFAEYARQNPSIGRIQLIRMSKDVSGQNRFKRLDMSKSAVRDKVSHAMTNDEIDHIFDADGFFMD
jgi:type III restriction enzyme